eukprot:6180243-Pleurochrysis_carterae.AAC.4
MIVRDRLMLVSSKFLQISGNEGTRACDLKPACERAWLSARTAGGVDTEHDIRWSRSVETQRHEHR